MNAYIIPFFRNPRLYISLCVRTISLKLKIIFLTFTNDIILSSEKTTKTQQEKNKTTTTMREKEMIENAVIFVCMRQNKLHDFVLRQWLRA